MREVTLASSCAECRCPGLRGRSCWMWRASGSVCRWSSPTPICGPRVEPPAPGVVGSGPHRHSLVSVDATACHVRLPPLRAKRSRSRPLTPLASAARNPLALPGRPPERARLWPLRREAAEWPARGRSDHSRSFVRTGRSRRAPDSMRAPAAPARLFAGAPCRRLSRRSPGTAPSQAGRQAGRYP
jgi:hypothetical protein